MASVNKSINKKTELTHGGTPVLAYSAKEQLERAVMCCFLWEDQFYEDGVDISKRMEDLVGKVQPKDVYDIAIRARQEGLRHVPLFIAVNMLKHPEHKKLVSQLLPQIIMRADELTEFLALYWESGKTPIANQAKKGLAKAFTKFDEYALGKYNRDGKVKLKDVLFLTHPKAESPEQQELWNKLVNDTLATPDTWEVALSAGRDKKETFERLINEKKLGGLALIRNLRNMQEAGVDKTLIKTAISNMKVGMIEPFRFIAAARHASDFEKDLEGALFRRCAEYPKSNLRVAIMCDESGSMHGPSAKLSSKSDMDRKDASRSLAMIAREIFSDVDIYVFHDTEYKVRPRNGFALYDELGTHGSGGTNLIQSINNVQKKADYDLIIVITDEQATDGWNAKALSDPHRFGYVINVGSYKNGITHGKWTGISGFSEGVIKYILKDIENKLEQ